MYSIHEPKDRIIVCICVSVIASFVARTIIVSGVGGPHTWDIKTKTYYLSDFQNAASYSLLMISVFCFIIIITSSIQIAYQWFKRHNSIQVFEYYILTIKFNFIKVKNVVLKILKIIIELNNFSCCSQALIPWLLFIVSIGSLLFQLFLNVFFS